MPMALLTALTTTSGSCNCATSWPNTTPLNSASGPPAMAIPTIAPTYARDTALMRPSGFPAPNDPAKVGHAIARKRGVANPANTIAKMIQSGVRLNRPIARNRMPRQHGKTCERAGLSKANKMSKRLALTSGTTTFNPSVKNGNSMEAICNTAKLVGIPFPFVMASAATRNGIRKVAGMPSATALRHSLAMLSFRRYTKATVGSAKAAVRNSLEKVAEIPP
mmetsp:Transcript_8932/g.23225  ORF Transcript_8932/g.23225 Transcript_8932/m.23225 type:complete len:221 (+) Transcript_8932:164-826(+)